MNYILTADIGGTNPRFAMVEILGKNSFVVKKIKNIDTDINNIIDSVNDFLRECSEDKMTTHKACFCVAGPIKNNCCENPTNLKFPIYEEEIILGTAISEFLMINDFEAIGYAISNMNIKEEIENRNLNVILNSQNDFSKINTNGNMAVIGPGTGLGVSYLVKNLNNKFIVSDSEGGHSSITHRGNLNELFDYIREKSNCVHVEKEELVSGKGIRNIISFFLEDESYFSDFLKENPEYIKFEEEVLVNNDQESTDNMIKEAFEKNHDVAKLVSSLVKKNGKALLTMKLFMEFLGIACQDVALHGKTTGGLFIAGGIPIKNKDLLINQNDFRRGFYDNVNENIKKNLKEIPIYLVEDYDISFIGCGIAFQRKFS